MQVTGVSGIHAHELSKSIVSHLVPLSRIRNDQPVMKNGQSCIIASTTTDIVCARDKPEWLQLQENRPGRGLKKLSDLSLAPGYYQL